jgi:hypothetical protein
MMIESGMSRNWTIVQLSVAPTNLQLMKSRRLQLIKNWPTGSVDVIRLQVFSQTPSQIRIKRRPPR